MPPDQLFFLGVIFIMVILTVVMTLRCDRHQTKLLE